MPRRRLVAKKEVQPDTKFNDPLVALFINAIMKKGKKSLAESILYNSLDIIKEKTNEDSLKIFKKAIDNTKPMLEVRSRRVGGSTYQIPVEVKFARRIALSIRWLIASARSRKDYTMSKRLAAELVDAANKTGMAVKKKEDTHKMAEANKAFAHYRW